MIIRLARRFLRQPPRRQWLLLEAALWLTVARLAILMLSIAWLMRSMGRLESPANVAPVDECGKDLARDIAWAITRTAPVLPFELVCLPRGLAAWQMLHVRRIPGRLHFGAEPQPAGVRLKTHAWVEACGVEVSGYPEAFQCVEIGFIAS